MTTSRTIDLSHSSYGPPREWSAMGAALARSAVAVDEITLRVVDVGVGPPILLLHGIGNTWRFWTATIGPLARSHRVVALDLPGFGDSGVPRGPLTPWRLVDLIGQACDQLHIEDALVVGHSMGALAALALARRRPDVASRVAIIAGAVVSIHRLHERPNTALAGPGLALKYAFALATAAIPAPTVVLDVVARNRLLRSLTIGQYLRYPSQVPSDVVRDCITGTGSAGVLALARVAHQFDLRECAQSLAQRVLVVNGSHDALSPLHDVTRLLSWLPSADGVVLTDTGHWPMIERPDALNGLLAEFLASS